MSSPPLIHESAGGQPPGGPAIKVLVADDHPLVRSGFKMVLEAEPDIEVVAEAATGGEAVSATLLHRPDVILMDVRMPGQDGLSATVELGRWGLAARVLILTTFDNDDYVHRALRAGAGGFLLKDVDPPELVRAVRLVAGNETLLAPAVTARLADRYAQGPSPEARREAFAALTARELEVLTLLVHGLDKTEAGARLFISAATVKTHITRIFAKLGLSDRAQAVRLGYETGLVEPGRGLEPRPGPQQPPHA